MVETMKAFAWDQENPLARVKGETQKANRALSDYVAMGPGRSLLKLRHKYIERTSEEELPPTKWLRTLAGWSTRYAWQARLARWDELEREGEEEVWRTRRRETREQEWKSSSQLLKRVDQMLIYPLVQATQEEDGMVTIIKPVRWTQADISRFMEAASKLRRLAAEMETERKQLEIISEDDLDTAIATELARLAGISQETALRASEEEDDAGSTKP